MSQFRRRASAARTSLCVVLAAALGIPRAAQANDEETENVQKMIEAARRDLASLSLSISATAPAASKDETLALSKTRSGSHPQQRVARHVARPVKLPKPQWMQRLVLPDLPVRWDDQLVSQLKYFRDDPRGRTQIAAWFKRSGRYERMIEEKLKAKKLPEELLYIAMIESGFDPGARSDAGAVGMWQLVESTGREYGLTVNTWADQRLSPEHSTNAALSFFESLYQRLGSWPLAFAAYNMGYNALARAIRKYNSNDFWVLAQLEAGLPYETIGYVAKVTACAIVGENPGEFGLTGLSKYAAVDTALVTVSGGTSLGRIARAAGLSVSDLQALNPELKRPRLPPDMLTFQVHIPAAAENRFERRFEAYRSLTPTHRKHPLRLGETLADVAQIYGTTEGRLRRLNGLSSKEEVRRNAALVVPDVEPVPLHREARPVVGVPKKRISLPNRERVFYGILAGDTLEEIAEGFKVSVRDLSEWNDLDPNAAPIAGMFLQVFVIKGQDLSRVVVLQPEDVEIVTVGTEKFYNGYEAQQNRKRIRYVVQKGDTLASLSKRFGLSVGSIARINRFSRWEDPPPDTEIILYVPN